MKIPRVESVIITVFFLCIALWAISKCSSRRAQTIRPERAAAEEDERPAKRDTIYVPQPQAQPQPQSRPAAAAPAVSTNTGLPKLQNPPPAPTEETPAATTTPGARPALSNESQTPPPATAAKYSTLFVTIDGLNMRKEPNRKSPVVAQLKLDEQVFFLNKKSEKPEEINLGLEKVTDYWVNVRTKSGKEGWVFGAGVHFYKMKRKGVLER